MTDTVEPTIVAIAGPKGGVGKSFLSLNLAAALAVQRPGVVLVDLDLGGPNLHLMLGRTGSGPGLSEFIAGRSELADLIRETGMEGLRIIPGSAGSTGLANLLQWQKVKLINNLRKLPAETVVLDLGAGSTFNTLDFFSAAQVHLLALTPELTAALNTYSFIKSLLHRQMLGALKAGKYKAALARFQKALEGETEADPGDLPGLIRDLASLDAEAAGLLEDLLAGLKPRLILNMVDHPRQSRVAQALDRMSRKRLGLGLELLGQVPYDPKVRLAVHRLEPLFRKEPDSPAGLALSSLAEGLAGILGRPGQG